MKYYEIKNAEVHSSNGKWLTTFIHAPLKEQTGNLLKTLGKGKHLIEGALRYRLNEHEVLFLW